MTITKEKIEAEVATLKEEVAEVEVEGDIVVEVETDIIIKDIEVKIKDIKEDRQDLKKKM